MQETLYILNSNFELSRHKNTIVYTQPDSKTPEKVKTKIIPINRLKSIEIYGNVKISTPLFKMCNLLKIPCFLNTFHGVPIGQFIPSNALSGIVRLEQYRTFLNNNKKLNIAKAIVYKATQERIRILQKFDKENEFKNKTSKINHYSKRLDGQKNLSELRGIEGNIMKIFFEIFSELLQNLPFNGRSQQPPKDETNALLSFGNVVLYNSVQAEIYRTGLDPIVGFLHELQENRNSFALDLAEIFRPIIIDNLILTLDRNNLININHFEKDDTKCYLNQDGKKIWLTHYKKFLQYSIEYKPLKRDVSVQEEIKLECYNIVKYFTGQKKEYLPINFNNN